MRILIINWSADRGTLGSSYLTFIRRCAGHFVCKERVCFDPSHRRAALPACTIHIEYQQINMLCCDILHREEKKQKKKKKKKSSTKEEDEDAGDDEEERREKHKKKKKSKDKDNY